MKSTVNLCLAIAGTLYMSSGYSQSNKSVAEQKKDIRKITWRLSEQKNIATPEQILDNQFIPIGDKEPNGIIIEDTKNLYKGNPVYKFICTGEANRIELSSTFGTKENLKGYSDEEINDLSKIFEGYINSFHGNYGDIVTYDWYTRFPEAESPTKGGIIAQIHGRPDRTLLINPKGEMLKVSIKEMTAILDTMYFDKHIGKNIKTKKPNGWRVDAAAGGPIAEMSYRPPYLYMLVRSSAERVSDSETRTRPYPNKVPVGKVIGTDGKTGFLAFSEPTSNVPINKWIHFKMEIKYSKYSHTSDEVLEKGYIKMWMDDKVLCDIKNVDIGKNDELGPYFKYGIYKPFKDGFTVEHSGFTETIQKQ
ncbi:polysaccharide lyase [Flavobacterium seoulense]|uniref:Heparin lyase n=1 Tax=Flavobacterium seoulense TaxID=1492738 RepID=A0A066WSX6_9FLAO|nr:polysaccharide lyase [Flavobacterium seoulense]KDN55678.1 heparin lyase [Flavobacterium seoulense]